MKKAPVSPAPEPDCNSLDCPFILGATTERFRFTPIPGLLLHMECNHHKIICPFTLRHLEKGPGFSCTRTRSQQLLIVLSALGNQFTPVPGLLWHIMECDCHKFICPFTLRHLKKGPGFSCTSTRLLQLLTVLSALGNQFTPVPGLVWHNLECDCNIVCPFTLGHLFQKCTQ